MGCEAHKGVKRVAFHIGKREEEDIRPLNHLICSISNCVHKHQESWLYSLSLTFSVKYAQFRKKMFSFVFKQPAL